MPSKDLISKLQSDNNVIFETARIKSGITAILSKTQSTRVREAKIGDYIKIEYAELASKFEFNKARDHLMKSADAAVTSSVEFFDQYMQIITEMVKETSDELVNQANETRTKAEAALEEAQKNYKDAEDKYKNAVAMDMDKALNKKVDKEYILNKYADDVSKAEIAFKNAQAKLNGCTDFKPYTPNTDYFGISEADVNKMLENQVNYATYMDVRRTQLAAVTATNPAFMDDLREAFPKNKAIDYTEATAGVKRRIHHVYATRQLMKETLDSKTGFWGWVWRNFSHRAEAKAMRNYIKEADAALKAAKFGENENDIVEAEKATTEKGCLYEQYKRSGAQEYIKEKFVVDEKKNAMIKAEKDKIAEISKLPIEDQFFEMKFRPATDRDTLTAQIKAFREVSQIVTAKKDKLPKDVVSVFKLTSKKMSKVKEIAIKSPVANVAEAATWACEEAEDELIERGAHDNYQPMKFSEVKAIAEQKEAVTVDLGKDDFVPVSAPVEENKSLEKESPVIQ